LRIRGFSFLGKAIPGRVTVGQHCRFELIRPSMAAIMPGTDFPDARAVPVLERLLGEKDRKLRGHAERALRGYAELGLTG
jgi:hypothetical protein